MEVDYALVTSSALPEQVKQSESFMHIDEGQWKDLLQYSKEIEASSSKEKILVLLVAQGTPEEDKLEEEKALQANQVQDRLGSATPSNRACGYDSLVCPGLPLFAPLFVCA